MARWRAAAGWGLVLTILWAAGVEAETRVDGRPSAAAAPVLPSAEQRAEKYVRHAVQFDLLGDAAGRDMMFDWANHLAPDNELANWHQGRLKQDGKFRSIDESLEQIAAESDRAEFRRLRARYLGSVEGELTLARWCVRNGQSDVAKLFYRRVLENPQTDNRTRADVRRKLGLKRYQGEWLTAEEIDLRQTEEESLRAAFEKWSPQLRQWQAIPRDAKNITRVRHAVREIREIDDPGLIPVADVFVRRLTGRVSEAVVNRLAQFPQFEATEALAHYALMSPEPKTRSSAIDALKSRPLHEFVPLLLDALVAPVKTRWQVQFDELGNIRYQHNYFKAGREGNIALTIEQRRVPILQSIGIRPVRDGPDGDYFPIVIGSQWEGNRLAAIEGARRAARERDAQLETENFAIGTQNAFVFAILEATTEGPKDRDVSQWWDWWQEYNQTQEPRPTRYLYHVTQQAYLYQPAQVVDFAVPRHSCFPAGTTVWTDYGLAAIETIEVGDRVLSQDVDTGELMWKPVVRTTAGAPTADLACLKIDGEVIRPTKGHVLWRSGTGWRIADRIAAAYRVHTLRGSQIVEHNAEAPVPDVVYNLVVQDFNTYFVGRTGVLVHDITERRPTQAIVPGLVGR